MGGAEAIIAGAALGGIDRVVLGGGDGTLNAGIPGLLRVGLPLGILPLGTANDFARSLGIPPSLEAAARMTSHVSMPCSPQSWANSLTSAMLTARNVFSSSLAISAARSWPTSTTSSTSWP